MSTDPFRYWAFISYSHRDRRWGEWIHRQLESYRVPKRLVGSAGAHGPVPARLFPIFRDREELSTGAKLSDVLDRAIAESRFYIVVCSPNAAASRWVNEEIRLIKRLGRADRILCLIVDGEPYASDAGAPERECFAPALRHEVGPDGELPERAPEPLAADLRDGADGRDGAKLKLLAGLLGVGYDELRRRDLVARNRRLGIAAGIAGVVAIAMAALTVRAVFAERAAEKSRQQGEELIGFMLGDLRGKLEPLGKLDILDAVGDQAMGYFAQLDRRKLSEAQLISRAKALRQIGDVRFQQGRSVEAANSFDAALALNRELAARKPDDADLQFELAQAEFWVGFASWKAKQFDRTEPHWQRYLEISTRMSRQHPAEQRWRLEQAYAENNLASLAFGRRRYAEASSRFQTVVDLLSHEPHSEEVDSTITNAYSWQATTLQMMGQPREGIPLLQRVVTESRALSASRPGDRVVAYNHVLALSALAYAANSAGDVAIEGEAVDEGSTLIEALRAHDPSNLEFERLGVRFALGQAYRLADSGNAAEAARMAEAALAAAQSVWDRDRNNVEVLNLISSAQELGHELALVSGHSTRASRIESDYETLCDPGAGEANDIALACIRLHLMRADHSALEKATEPFERELEAARPLIATLTDPREAAEMKGRFALLRGDYAATSTTLEPLLAKGFRPTLLRRFIGRHCTAKGAAVPATLCRAANLGR